MNSSCLNSQSRGSPPHPAAHPTLLGAAVPAARTPGWLLRHHLIHQLATQVTELTEIEFNAYTKVQTVLVQELMHSHFDFFAAGAASAIATPSATAHKSSLSSSLKHPLAGLIVRYLGTTTGLMLNQQVFRKGKTKT